MWPCRAGSGQHRGNRCRGHHVVHRRTARQVAQRAGEALQEGSDSHAARRGARSACSRCCRRRGRGRRGRWPGLPRRSRAWSSARRFLARWRRRPEARRRWRGRARARAQVPVPGGSCRFRSCFALPCVENDSSATFGVTPSSRSALAAEATAMVCQRLGVRVDVDRAVGEHQRRRRHRGAP